MGLEGVEEVGELAYLRTRDVSSLTCWLIVGSRVGFSLPEYLIVLESGVLCMLGYVPQRPSSFVWHRGGRYRTR